MQHISKSLQLNLECKDKANSFLFIPVVATNSLSNLTLHVSTEELAEKSASLVETGLYWCAANLLRGKLFSDAL